jgi:hypothetical protein
MFNGYQANISRKQDKKLDCVGLPESLMSPEEDSVEEGGIFTPGNSCCRSFSCKVNQCKKSLDDSQFVLKFAFPRSSRRLYFPAFFQSFYAFLL